MMIDGKGCAIIVGAAVLLLFGLYTIIDTIAGWL